MLTAAILFIAAASVSGEDATAPRIWPKPEQPMTLTGDHLRYEPATGILSVDGNVVLRTDKMTVHGDHITYDGNTGQAEAKGHASLATNKAAALADEVSVNVRTQETDVRGALFMQKADISLDALSQATPEQLLKAGKTTMALKGERIHKASGNAFEVNGLNFTPCDCDPLNPTWKILSTKAHVVAGDHALLLWPVIYVGPVPVLAFPVLDLPLTDRRSGLLIPKPGVDPKRGFSLEMPVFVTLGRSYDLTITPGYYVGANAEGSDLPATPRSVRGPRLITEFRYAPAKDVVGSIRLGLIYDLFPRRDPVLADCLTTPNLPGCLATSGMRGMRGEASIQHSAPLGANWYSRIDASLVSDGYYLGDLATDLFTQGTPYLRSTAAVYRRDTETYFGLDVAYRQDLRYGFSFIGPPEKGPDNQLLRGPNTLQRLPALTFALPERPVWQNLMVGVKAELTRIAPLFGGTGDEGSDGVFTCPPGQGVLSCLGQNGQGNGKYDPGEREARMRLDVNPRLSYPFQVAKFLRFNPSISYREDVYVGEVTGNFRQRGYGMAGLQMDTELGRTFGSGPDALKHSIMPSAEIRYVPRVFGSTLGNYDEIDSAIVQPAPGKTGMAQAVVEVRQRLYSKGHEWARLDVGQGFDMLGGGRVADTYARAAVELGPFKASGLARFDPVRVVLAQLSAQARYTQKSYEVYVQYDTFAAQGSDRLRRPLDSLVGPAATGLTTEAQQIIAGARYMLSFGLGLSYEAVVVPQATVALQRLAQQRIGLTFAPACGCWSLEGGVRLIPTATNIQVNFEANLTIAHFGSFGTGG